MSPCVSMMTYATISWLHYTTQIFQFEKRKIYYDKYQEILADECPMIYLYSPLRLIAVRNRVGNVYPTILGGMVHNTSELYINYYPYFINKVKLIIYYMKYIIFSFEL